MKTIVIVINKESILKFYISLFSFICDQDKPLRLLWYYVNFSKNLNYPDYKNIVQFCKSWKKVPAMNDMINNIESCTQVTKQHKEILEGIKRQAWHATGEVVKDTLVKI